MSASYPCIVCGRSRRSEWLVPLSAGWLCRGHLLLGSFDEQKAALAAEGLPDAMGWHGAGVIRPIITRREGQRGGQRNAPAAVL